MAVSFPERLSGFRFWPLEFDKRSQLVEPRQLDRLREDIPTAGMTDLLVLSHGWNNDEAEALNLYQSLMGRVDDVRGDRFAGREVGVAGIFWPSKKFADSEVIPGGAASLEGDVPAAALIEDIQQLRGFFDAANERELIDELIALVPRLDSEPVAVKQFGELSQQLLGEEWSADEEIEAEIPPGLLSMPGEDLINSLSVPRDEEMASSGGEGGIAATPLRDDHGAAGPEGGAAFLGSLFSGLRSGAKNALNLLTYFQMKKRAGEVGADGLAPALRDLASASEGLRFHLAGHSFGGRLVTAAVHGVGDDAVFPAHSMTLLQAAFSHNGFAEDFENGSDGFFRKVLSGSPGLKGPVVVTHTSRDLPNRWAYPMASRLARQKAAAFGGPDDVYGAMGSNGAQHTREAVFERLLDTDGTYEFRNGSVHNLESSNFISGHGAVTGTPVGNALVAAMVTTDT